VANPAKRFKGKLAYLLKKYGDRKTAIAKARGYSGGKTRAEKRKQQQQLPEIEMQFPDEFPFDSYTACVERMEGEVSDPNAFCAAWVKHSKGHWPAEAGEEVTGQALSGDWKGAVAKMQTGSFLNVITLEELEGQTSEIEILRTGEWQHPEYGTIKVKESDIDKFIENFNNNARGVDLAVDQAHKPDEGAAGWFKTLRKEDSSDGVRLMATIEWTPYGKELVENKVFRYFSPEFTFNYTDAETGKTFKNVLFGGALTNRPFIKNMQPVLLEEQAAAEITAAEIALIKDRVFKSGGDADQKSADNNTTNKTKGGVNVNLNEKLKGILALSEEAEEQEIETAVEALVDTLSGVTDKLELSEDKADKDAILQAIEDMGKGETQLQEENKRLSERVAKLEATNQENEWQRLSEAAMREGRLTPKMAEKLKARFFKDPEGTKEVLEALEPVVSMKEQGSASQGESNIALFENKVNEKIEQKQMTYADAAQAVARENPDLWKEVDRERRGAH